MTIYIDSDCKCYTEDAEGRRAIETEAFDGKAKEYIEAYRFVPTGETWVRSDGTVFTGEMTAPWKGYDTLNAIQIAADRTAAEADITIAELDEAYSELLYEHILLEYGL